MSGNLSKKTEELLRQLELHWVDDDKSFQDQEGFFWKARHMEFDVKKAQEVVSILEYLKLFYKKYEYIKVVQRAYQFPGLLTSWSSNCIQNGASPDDYQIYREKISELVRNIVNKY